MVYIKHKLAKSISGSIMKTPGDIFCFLFFMGLIVSLFLAFYFCQLHCTNLQRKAE